MRSLSRLQDLEEDYNYFKDDCNGWEETGEDEFTKESLIKELRRMQDEYQDIHEAFVSKVLFESIPPFLSHTYLQVTTLLAELKRLLF